MRVIRPRLHLSPSGDDVLRSRTILVFERTPVIDDIRAARDAALAQVDAAESLESVTALDTRLLGKKGQLANLKKQLGTLASINEKKAAGQAVNEAMDAVGVALDTRRAVLG